MLKWLHTKIFGVKHYKELKDQWVIVYHRGGDIVLGNVLMPQRDAGPMAKLMLAKAKENGIDIIGIVEAGDVQLKSLIVFEDL